MTAGVSTLAVGESGLGEAAGASVDEGSGDAVASGAAAVVGDGCTASSRCAGAHAATAVASSTSAMTGRISGNGRVGPPRRQCGFRQGFVVRAAYDLSRGQPGGRSYGRSFGFSPLPTSQPQRSSARRFVSGVEIGRASCRERV